MELFRTAALLKRKLIFNVQTELKLYFQFNWWDQNLASLPKTSLDERVCITALENIELQTETNQVNKSLGISHVLPNLVFIPSAIEK